MYHSTYQVVLFADMGFDVALNVQNIYLAFSKQTLTYKISIEVLKMALQMMNRNLELTEFFPHTVMISQVSGAVCCAHA